MVADRTRTRMPELPPARIGLAETPRRRRAPGREEVRGLDVVEVVMAVEQEFGIRIPDAEAEKLETVGKLHACIAGQVAVRRPGEEVRVEAGGRSWTEADVWEAVRRFVIERLDVKPEQVRPGAYFVRDPGADCARPARDASRHPRHQR